MTEVKDLASRLRRFIATVIDLLVTALTGVLVMLVTGLLENAEAYSSTATIVMRALTIGVIAYLLLHGWLLHRRGQTIGKAMMGIRIIDTATGNKALLWKLLLIRLWFLPMILLLAITPLALIPIVDQGFIFTRSRRCLHDWLCGTSVVNFQR